MGEREYKAALQRPSKQRIGWAYADADSVLAATAEAIGRRCCIRPVALYDWAKAHEIDLVLDIIRLDQEPQGALLIAVLSNIHIVVARGRLQQIGQSNV